MSIRRDEHQSRNRQSGTGTPAWKTQDTSHRSIHNSARRPAGYTERYRTDLEEEDELVFDEMGGEGIKKNRNFMREEQAPVRETSVPAWKRSSTEKATQLDAEIEEEPIDRRMKNETSARRRTAEVPVYQRLSDGGPSRRRSTDEEPVRRSAKDEEPVRRSAIKEEPVRRRSNEDGNTRRRTSEEEPVRKSSEGESRRRTSTGRGTGSGSRSSRSRRRRAARRRRLIRLGVLCAACLFLLVGGAFAVRGVVRLIGGGSNIIARALPDEKEWSKKLYIASAGKEAAQYDYDKAINMLKEYADYETDEEITAKIAEYEATKATLVEYPVEEITHVFFHMLLFEPEVSFGETCDNPTGMNQYMTTVNEFNKIIQSMYDKGYVLVSLYDVAAPGPDGNFQAGKIMLPPGKKAFVLSEDDVCCYHAYENAGIADRFVIDEATGKVKTHYTYLDGREEIGDFDVMPIIDSFVEKHPDFSYKGAKGVLAFTGYNGILGYRTDTTYDDNSPDVVDRDRHEQAWLDAHPGFNYDQEIEECKKVCKAARDNGWLLASHSWGHLWQEKMGDVDFDEDTKKWMERVYPLLGECDIWIYPNGQDVDNSFYQHRFETLQSYGFKYFCPVNSLQYSTRIDSYGLNQGRRNLDGYRMYYDMIDPEDDWLSDLFDVNEVFDPARPTPVPEI